MSLKRTLVATLSAAAIGGAFATAAPSTAPAAEAAHFVPLLVYRTGPYAPSGVPIANGFADYFTLLNERDGGINGVKVQFEECETKYDTKLGVECYEKLKDKGTVGAALVNPYSTGITYQLIPKAPVDKIPLLSMGYGRTASADGRIFEWAFNAPTTYWSQASAFIKFVGQKEGGMDKLKGKKIAHVFHNSPYGKEANPTLEALAGQLGFELTLLAVDHPGQEQKATWLQIRRLKPDWVFMSGWGVMNQVAIKEAAAVNYPMERFVGNWWSGTESDVVPAGDDSKGYISATFHGAGTGYAVIQDILKHVYEKKMGAGERDRVGEVLYNRAVVNAIYSAEAIRTAMEKFGKKPMAGEQVRWGLENLNLSKERLKAIGAEGLINPHKVTCADHEGNGPVVFQQWNGKSWKFISDWISPMREVVRPMIEADAAKYAKENNLTPRANCM